MHLQIRRFAALCFCFILCNLPLLAQFGGGGGFSGGRSSGGSSGGGGGGDGGLIYLLFMLVVHYPVIGIPVLIVVVIVGIIGSKKSGSYAVGEYQSSVISKGRQMQASHQKESAIAGLQAKDAEFNEGRFLSNVKKAHGQLQDAWTRQSVDPVQHFISDSVYERCKIQFGEQIAVGYKEHVDNLEIYSCDVAHVEATKLYDIITVRISASMDVYRTDLKTGDKISGHSVPDGFTEFWSFIRKLDVKSSEHSLYDGNCPNCGNSLTLNQNTSCMACGAMVKSGQYDWILSEITQACEWDIKEDEAIPGQAEILKSDPGFSIQHLEARVSVMFWRIIHSYREGKTNAINKMATETFCDSLKPKFAIFPRWPFFFCEVFN